MTGKPIHRAAIAGGAFALAALLAACVVVDDRPPPPRPGPPGPPICTREYAPVCARSGRDRQTFANACLADAAGYRIVRDGPCRNEGGGGGGGGGGGQQLSCPQVYDPVCARRGNHVRTFGNSCEAGVADYRVLHGGACR